MNKKDKQEILQNAINAYGEHDQVNKACEELGELIAALQKANMKKDEIANEHVAEEMADVYIMIEQLKLMELIDKKLYFINIDFKLKRLKQRLIKEGKWGRY